MARIPLILAVLLSLGSGLHAQSGDLAAIFKDPPQEARPQVWWHWMDGNVSREGIRKDLEWMKRSGIGGFHQFDAGGIDMPRAAKVKLPYLSEGWQDAFRYALRLADSLGIEAAIASAPGWSSTGGTWVEPQDAVKKLEWRTVDVRGGEVDVRLPDLYRVTGPYQDFFQGNDRVEIQPYGEDLYVLALRRGRGDLSMEEMGAVTTVSDSLVTVTFPKARKIRSFTLKSQSMGGRPRKGEPDCKNILEYSNDGRTWKTACRILPARIPYATEDIAPVKARFFRVRGEKLEGIELHSVFRINHSEELGGFSNNFDFNRFHTPKSTAPREVIDLTGKMSPDGTLRCSLPKGRWRIYRFGWSITGKVNHPASPEATGLEVDKLDKDAWLRYFHHYLDLYKELSGGMLGEKGIRYLLTDSYEAGSFTWTPSLPEEFKARRHYDLLPWLPVLAGEIIGRAQMSEAFLWDWRKTLGELFCENYERIAGLVDEYGLAGNYCETHEGSRAYMGDGMEPKLHATIPMAAIWMENTPTGSGVPSAIADIRESASAAHLTGKRIVAAESFSVNGDEGRAYTYCPENMKYIADVAMSAGLNRFVIHESASQPNDGYLPGLQLFRYGQWLHRNETWGEYAWVFTDYLARSSAMLQQGRPVADILLYYGEDSNITALYGGESFDLLPDVPSGYEYDFVNPSALLAMDPSASALKVLWLDGNCETMSLEILQKIREFADAGVRICGAAPVRCAGLKVDRKAFRRLVRDIWHSGRANVFSTLREALEGTEPDCLASLDGKEASPTDFRYVHRTLPDGTQVYWVRNFSGSDVSASISFRDHCPNAVLFNPEDGGMSPLEVESEGERVRVDIPMISSDAFFVVFSDSASVAGGSTGLTDRKGVEIGPLSLSKGWRVRFSQKGGGTAEEIFQDLHSWTESTDPVVRYFSGTAVYTASFEIGKETLDSFSRIAMDLGSVKNIAEVIINGKNAGVLWKAPFTTEDIKPLLHPGTNSLEIKVTNLWRNRMIGDVQPGETHPVTAIRRFYKAGDPLLPSGLLGPVSLVGRTSAP
ncbi:MAG: hypothetical protein IJ205_05730 [Bacteroidales bacterium]|nr:hypothetical protein [Bacteroidales bacterium]